MRMIESDKVVPLVRLLLMSHPAADEIVRCVQEIVDAHTIDAVEVVRCRDCKFGDWDSEPDDALVCMRTKDGFWRSGNDFCSYGDWKEGAER